MVDQPVGPQSQNTIHRCGSQCEKDSGCDPMAEIQFDLDRTITVYCWFIRGLFCMIRRSRSDPSHDPTVEDAFDFE